MPDRGFGRGQRRAQSPCSGGSGAAPGRRGSSRSWPLPPEFPCGSRERERLVWGMLRGARRGGVGTSWTRRGCRYDRRAPGAITRRYSGFLDRRFGVGTRPALGGPSRRRRRPRRLRVRKPRQGLRAVGWPSLGAAPERARSRSSLWGRRPRSRVSVPSRSRGPPAHPSGCRRAGRARQRRAHVARGGTRYASRYRGLRWEGWFRPLGLRPAGAALS